MRLKLALVLLLGLPAAVVGQSVAGGAFAPLPPIGLPLPEIGLPLPEIGLPPANHAHPRVRRDHPSRGIEPTVVYLVPVYYGWDFPYRPQPTASTVAAQQTPPNQPEQKPATGSLRLELQPSTVLQIYVDGVYVGTSDDLNGELTLEPGTHNIEVRAPGYETLSVDVKIVAERTITYRGALTPEAGLTASAKATTVEKPRATGAVVGATEVTPHATESPATATTFYLIPRCYIGNVPPKDARLPATCDQSRVITFGK
jgi:hypothetical protein